MTNVRRLAITMAMAFSGFASQVHGTESLDHLPQVPKAKLQEMLFHDMCIHSAPAEDTADAGSVESNSESKATATALEAR